MYSTQKPSQFSASGKAHAVLCLAGLIAIASIYLSSTANFSSGARIFMFVGVATAYIVTCLVSFTISKRDFFARTASAAAMDPHAAEFDEIEHRLIALDEAHQFFGSSLNAADMFRLVSSRVGEIFPFAASALFVPDEAGEKLTVAQIEGRNADVLEDVGIDIAEGLSGKAFASRAIEIDEDLTYDTWAIPEEKLAGFRSAIAIPLLQNDKILGVFELFTDHAVKKDDDTLKLLEAIGEHVTPLFRSSMAFDRSISSALTDVLTGLPNERAFYMVLENQLAESTRFRDERPLTILSIDIRDFAAVNSMLGHSIGDRMLEFAGARIAEHLRKMDFLARTVNDEFGVILPTASEKTAMEIIERIKSGFTQSGFAISDEESVTISLNVGWATFWKDGETVEQLIRSAQLRKRQEKSEEPAGVLWFPKEYVN